MNSLSVSETAYRGVGWAYGLVKQDRVIHSHYITTDHSPTPAEALIAMTAFEREPEVTEARAIAEAAWLDVVVAERRGDPKRIARAKDAYAAASVRIRLGMMTCGGMLVDFNRTERRHIGISEQLHV